MWVCPECGSSEIEARAFVKRNSKQFVSWDETRIEEWCPDCYEDIMSISMGEYKERQRERDNQRTAR